MSTEEAHAHLLTASTSLQHNDPAEDVAKALKTMEDAVRIKDPEKKSLLRIYHLPVFYSSANARTANFNIYKERNPAIANSFTEEEWNKEEGHFGIVGDAIHLAVQKGFVIMAGTLQNPVFSHSFFNKVYKEDTAERRAEHASRDTEWHEFVVFLEQQKVSTTCH